MVLVEERLTWKKNIGFRLPHKFCPILQSKIIDLSLVLDKDIKLFHVKHYNIFDIRSSSIPQSGLQLEFS